MPTVHVNEGVMEQIEDLQEEWTCGDPSKSLVVAIAINGMHSDGVKGEKTLVQREKLEKLANGYLEYKDALEEIKQMLQERKESE